MSKDRAHKLIAQSGLMSRRKAEEAIAAGRVALNGEVFKHMGQVVDPETDTLTIDGQKVELKTIKKTFVFYKPRGVMTTKSDELGRPTVMDYFRDDPSLNPVGRLDFDSEGLLLLTHDGDLLLKLTHPRYGVKKIYEVEVTLARIAATARIEDLTEITQKLLSGVELEDGIGKFDEMVEVTDAHHDRTKPRAADAAHTFIVTVSEGRNRFIRRMFQAVGLSVARLKRTQMGDYQLDGLLPGEKREV
jgi:23S rRNA pseudouridine2605 synthase